MNRFGLTAEQAAFLKLLNSEQEIIMKTSSNNSHAELIKSTIGLDVLHPHGNRPVLRKVEFYRLETGDVRLSPVNGHNLSQAKAEYRPTISAEEFEDRPFDPCNQSAEAIWALELCGYDVCGVGKEEDFNNPLDMYI